jgi:imidazolonepropionase-like amidohydrolase
MLEAVGHAALLTLARARVEQLRRSIPLAERPGVTVLAGTDMLGHGNLADEIAALTSLGMSPVAALAAASDVPRTYLGLPTIADGQLAELVTYDRDPREDPAVLRHPLAIVHAGTRIR